MKHLLTRHLALSIALHAGLFGVALWLYHPEGRGRGNSALIAVQLLPAEEEPARWRLTEEPPRPRVAEERPVWTPREAPVAPERVAELPPRAQRQPRRPGRLEFHPRPATAAPATARRPRPILEPEPASAPGGMALLAVELPGVVEEVSALEVPVDDSSRREGAAELPDAPSPAPSAPPAEGEADPAPLTPSKCLSFPKEYPYYSKLRGEEGTVKVEFEINADGTVGRIQIVASSGYPRLDRAAVASLQKARYAPATRRGKPVPTIKRLDIIYSLRDADEE